MSLSPLKIKSVSKPSLGTQLDPSIPLNKKLVGVWTFNEGSGPIIDKISGVKFTIPPGSSWASQKLKLGATGVVDTGLTAITGGTTSEWTISLMGYSLISAADTLIATGNEGAGNILIGTLSGFLTITFRGDVTWNTTIPYNPLKLVTITKKGTLYKAYHNGIISSFVRSVNISNTLKIGNQGGLYSGGGKYYDFLMVSSIAIDPPTIELLSINPWQIYQPTTQWVASESLVAIVPFLRQGSNYMRGQMNGSFRGI
jgi:hypothetical protein